VRGDQPGEVRVARLLHEPAHRGLLLAADRRLVDAGLAADGAQRQRSHGRPHHDF
jgi:hypothetical protein